jgi:hypothetical protein
MRTGGDKHAKQADDHTRHRQAESETVRLLLYD